VVVLIGFLVVYGATYRAASPAPLSQPTPPPITPAPEPPPAPLPPPAPSGASGIRGLVTIGPTCPVVREGMQCDDQPYSAKLIVTRAGGAIVARVTSGADGRYEIKVPPGTYEIGPEAGDILRWPTAPPQPVTVRSGTFTIVDISFDSGIR